MSKIDFSKEQEDYIVTQYVDKNKTKADLKREFEVSDSVIDRILKAHGVTIRNSRPNPKNDKQVSEEHRQAIIDAYLSGKGLVSAGAPYGCSQKVVETILKRAGIKKRTYEEAKQIQRMYSLNDNFFKTQSSEMAYILGFIAADGNVAKKENSISIQLQKEDAELLEKIKNITHVGVTSAIDLSDTRKNDIRSKLSEKLKKEVVVDWDVDSDIIAGLVLNIDETIVDNSIKHKLESLSSNIIKG